MRRPWAPYGLDGRSLAAVVSYIRGEWESALQLVDVGAEHPPSLARAMLGGVGLAVAAGRGETSSLELLPKLRPAWDREGFVAITCGSAAIDLYGDSGDLAGAIRIHDEIVELVSALWVNPVFQARIRLSALLLGQLATAARQASAAERAVLMERGAGLHEAAVQAADKAARRGPESQAWLSRVHAEHVRLQWLCAADGADRVAPDVMVKAWDDAVGTFRPVRSHLRSGAVAVAARAGAAPCGRHGASGGRAVTGDGGGSRARRPAFAHRAASGGAHPPAHPEDRSRELTAREQEVLSLVAQGRSNRQIADLLYISAKTVSVHVSNILAKLEAGGRTEAVAVARRRGLLTEDAGSAAEAG